MAGLGAYGQPSFGQGLSPYGQGISPYAQGPPPMYGQGPVPPHYGQWSSANGPLESLHGSPDEVRTIFITGFPKDVKERELQNLLRWWPGYEACQMNFKGDQPMGFALFSTAAHAIAATDALQNLAFDAETNAVLRAEMAKKNLYLKRGVDGGTVDQSKRMRTGEDHAPGQFNSTYNSSWGSQSYHPPAAPPYEPYGGFGASRSLPQHTAAPHFSPAGYAPVQNMKDNPPCNTLFVGNLGEATSESELRGLFGSQPGYRQMKVLKQGKSTVCFIEFVDVNSARGVHDSFQGAVLMSSDRGGMRIQYSKNPFGKRKDGESGGGGAPGMNGGD